MNRVHQRKALLLIGLFAPLALLYISGAARHSESVNTDMTRTDQSAYMNYAAKMHKSNYSHVGDRNRMPMNETTGSYKFESYLHPR